jgi:murein DD-endopeptidase MepM/ murein hydrolase activator NlpD
LAPLTHFDPDSPFAQLGLTPPVQPSAPAPAPSTGAPLTRREARERDAAANAPIHAPEYVAIRPEPQGLGELRPSVDPPRRSTTREQPAAAAKSAAARPAPARRQPGGHVPKSRKVKVRFTKARRPKASIGSKLLSLGALIGAGALLVGMSVPANAFMDSVESISNAAIEHAPGQSMEVSEDVAAPESGRDGYEVISYAELLRLKYSGLSYAYTATTGDVRWPFPYPVPLTDQFGVRYIDGGEEFHNGLDFVPGNGTPIYAIADGVVVTATELQWSYGNHVIIQHNLGGVDVQSLTAHMVSGSSPLKVGDIVKVGDFVGLVGDTGRAYGSHLHLEIHVNGVPVDPFAWLSANAVN